MVPLYHDYSGDPAIAVDEAVKRLRQTHDKVFQVPPIDWIEKMLFQFSKLLELNTNKSALAITEHCPTVKAWTMVRIHSSGGPGRKGFEPFVEMPFQNDFHQVKKHPLYQEIAATALHLQQLGLNISTIARRLCVGYKTVVKAIKWTEFSGDHSSLP